jgi:Ca2+-binding EF-hand superfamily protein
MTTPLTYIRQPKMGSGPHQGQQPQQVPARPSFVKSDSSEPTPKNETKEIKEQKLQIQASAMPGTNMATHNKPANKEKRRSLVQQNHAAMLSYIDRMSKAHSLFKAADTNKTGRITANQLFAVFGNEEAHSEWLTAFDKDVNGELTWEQFRDAMDACAKVPVILTDEKQQKEEGHDSESKREEILLKQNADIKRFADLFHKFKAQSSDKNAPITRDELFTVLSADPAHMGVANDAMTATTAILKEADKNHKDSISWSEFLEYMQNHGLRFH